MRVAGLTGLAGLVLLLFCGSLQAEEIRSFEVRYQGRVYRVPVEGWTFELQAGPDYRPVTDMAVAIKLARARDAFAQFLNPQQLDHKVLSELLSEVMSHARKKQWLNQFDQTFTNIAGSYIGGALRMAVGDLSGGASMARVLTGLAPAKSSVLDKVVSAMTVAAASGYAMTPEEALGVGLCFGRAAEQASAQAAQFQEAYFLKTGMGWWQKQPIHLPMLEKATVQACESLRLAYPAAVLMTEVTRRSGWDTVKGFFRNTAYGAMPAGLGDGMSMLDSALSGAGDKVTSVKALKAFDHAIRSGKGNPFTTDDAVYRSAVRKYCGIKDDPKVREIEESSRRVEEDRPRTPQDSPANNHAFSEGSKEQALMRDDPESIDEMDRLLDRYDQLLLNWKKDPRLAAGFCQSARPVLIHRWQKRGFSSSSEIERWSERYRGLKECLSDHITQELMDVTAYDLAEQELNDFGEVYEQIHRMPWVGLFIDQPQRKIEMIRSRVAKMRQKISDARLRAKCSH